MISFLIIGLLIIILLVAIVATFFPITAEEKIKYIKPYKKNDYSKFDF
jgi:hypothetical protein